MNEVWRDVDGYEGFYKVSSLGAVASTDLDGLDGRRKRKGRTLKPYISKDGQSSLSLMVDGEKEKFLVSNLVARAFIGPKPKGMFVVHLDGHIANDIETNLAYGTRREVMAAVMARRCDQEAITKEHMTQEVIRGWLDYRDGDLIWRKRSGLSVEVGQVAGATSRKDGRRQLNLCGAVYEYGHAVYLHHYGYMPSNVVARDGDRENMRIENLVGMTDSELAKYDNRISHFTPS